MTFITIHKSSCKTFFLYCESTIHNFMTLQPFININITFYFGYFGHVCPLIKKDNANLQKLWCLSACKKWIPPTFFFEILETCYFEYFENTWSCPSIMIVSPCRKLWCPKCWSQLVVNFDVYLHVQNQLHL